MSVVPSLQGWVLLRIVSTRQRWLMVPVLCSGVTEVELLCAELAVSLRGWPGGKGWDSSVYKHVIHAC